MKIVRVFPVLAVAALVLAACAGGDPALRKNPSFQEGYEDGCEAATDQGADFRDRTVGDQQRLQGDDAYRAGWSNGLQTCRRTNGMTETQPGTNPPLVPEPGSH
jgi:hypothetical protein